MQSMRSLLSAIVVTSLLAGLTSAAEDRRKPMEITGLVETIPSPDNRLELSYKKEQKKDSREDANSDHQIWLRSKIDPGKAMLLYSYQRSADVLWSPDSKIVAITDGTSSSESYVIVFRVSQKSVTKVLVLDPFVESRKIFPDWDHFYVQVVSWSEDSKFLTVELRGDYTEGDFTEPDRLKTRRMQQQATFTIP